MVKLLNCKFDTISDQEYWEAYNYSYKMYYMVVKTY